jgi:hypothetical protein
MESDPHQFHLPPCTLQELPDHPSPSLELKNSLTGISGSEDSGNWVYTAESIYQGLIKRRRPPSPFSPTASLFLDIDYEAEAGARFPKVNNLHLDRRDPCYGTRRRSYEFPNRYFEPMPPGRGVLLNHMTIRAQIFFVGEELSAGEISKKIVD